MKYEKVELEEAYSNLLKNQSMFGVLFGSFIGAVVSSALFLFFGQMSGVLIVFLLIPGAVIGFFAQYAGRAFEMKYRAIAAIFAFILHVFGCIFLISIHPIWLLLAFPSAAVALFFSKVKLNDVEKTAVWQKKMKLVQS